MGYNFSQHILLISILVKSLSSFGINVMCLFRLNCEWFPPSIFSGRFDKRLLIISIIEYIEIRKRLMSPKYFFKKLNNGFDFLNKYRIIQNIFLFCLSLDHIYLLGC